MPCAADIAGFFRFQSMNVSKPLKSHDPIYREPKYRIWIGGSATHLTHRTEIVQVVTTMNMSADLKSIAPRYHLLPMRIAS
jgi:hypothetical protein